MQMLTITYAEKGFKSVIPICKKTHTHTHTAFKLHLIPPTLLLHTHIQTLGNLHSYINTPILLSLTFGPKTHPHLHEVITAWL